MRPETNAPLDHGGWTQNIVRRAELTIASIAFLQQLNASALADIDPKLFAFETNHPAAKGVAQEGNL